MNRKNKILVGCLALLLVMSVGYALFSDTITINGTATAKGSFDVTGTCDMGIISEIGTVESLGLSAEGGYENDSCIVEDDVVTFKSDLLYPGARRYFTIKATNTGTIDAIISEKVTGQICEADDKEGTNQTCEEYNYYASMTNSNNTAAMFQVNYVIFEDADGTIVSLSEAITKGFLSSDGTNIILKPEQSVYRVMSAYLHEDYTNDTGSFYYSNTINLEYTAEQPTN